MAHYLQINDTLISYSLGDNLTSPSKVLFLVSDTQFSESERWFTLEYAYEYDQPIGDTQTIQLPFVAEIENKFYYSLPWRTIQLIDSTTPGPGAETPTPSPSPSATSTPTFFEEEPIDEYIYDNMEAVSIKGGVGESSSVIGYNNRKLDTIHGVNGVTGLTLETDIVTLTKPGRYYIKARSGSYMSEWTSTTIYFISGDYETQRFESQRRWCHAGTNSSDVVVTESSVVVDITQDTTFKIQTYITKAKSTNGLSYGGGASVFVQKLANADGGSSSGGSSSSGISASCDPFELARTTLHMQSDTTDGDSNVFDLYGFETIANSGVVHTTADARSDFGATNLKFDNTYLFVPNQSKLDFANDDFTIDFWYYKRNHNTSGDIDTIFTIEKSVNHSAGNSSMEFYAVANGVHQLLFDCTDGTYSDLTILANDATKIVDQTWNYITITRSGDDVYLYVNGVEAATTDLAGKQIAFDSSMYLTIGGRHGANISSMYLQDFRIRKGVSDVNPDVPTELVSVSCDGGGPSSSGGIGSNQLVTNKSNFYTSLPDVLLITHSTGSLGSFFLNWIENDYVYYQLGLIESATPIPAVIKFDNNNQGNFVLIYNATTDDFPNAEHSISEHLAAGRGIYYGGASSSGGSSSSGSGGGSSSSSDGSSSLSGGIGQQNIISTTSNYDGLLPDKIILRHNTVGEYVIITLRYISSTFVSYTDEFGSGFYVTWHNDSSGSWNNEVTGSHLDSPIEGNTTPSIKNLIDAGYGVFLGGGSSSSDSSSGGVGSSGSSMSFCKAYLAENSLLKHAGWQTNNLDASNLESQSENWTHTQDDIVGIKIPSDGVYSINVNVEANITNFSAWQFNVSSHNVRLVSKFASDATTTVELAHFNETKTSGNGSTLSLHLNLKNKFFNKDDFLYIENTNFQVASNGNSFVDFYADVDKSFVSIEKVNGGSSSGASNIVTGNYTGDDADTQTIELGFRPAMVHVKCTSAPYYGEMTQIDGLDGTSLRSYHTTNHSDGGYNIEITNTGFQTKTLVSGNNSTFNHSGSEYYYYAISGSSSTSAFEVSTNPNPIEIEAPSTTSDAENFMDNLTFKNPPNNITINDVVFHFISHSSEYIKYQGLSKYNDTYTIFFNDDTDGTLKMTSDDDTSIFVGVLSLISYKYE